jgi:hypothetical protein
MKNTPKTTKNRAHESRVSELRNQTREIPVMRVPRVVLQTNISAAC